MPRLLNISDHMADVVLSTDVAHIIAGTHAEVRQQYREQLNDGRCVTAEAIDSMAKESGYCSGRVLLNAHRLWGHITAHVAELLVDGITMDRIAAAHQDVRWDDAESFRIDLARSQKILADQAMGPA